MKVNNKMKINSVIVGVCFLLLGCMTGCDNYERKGTVTSEITINEASVTLFLEQTIQLKASPVELTFTWTSEDNSVASVNGNGLVTAVGEGSTFVVARSGGMDCRVPVTCVTKIEMQDFVLNAASVEANPGTKVEMWVTIDPPNANDASLPMWRSLDVNIATVDYKGVITGVEDGITDIVCNINGIERSVTVEVWTTKPFKGPHILSEAAPYTLKAADFDFGGRNNAWYDTNTGANQAGTAGTNYRIDNGDNNSGSVGIQSDQASIGYTAASEWLIYTIEVQDAGEYIVEVEVSANAGSAYRLYVDEVNVFEDNDHVNGTVSLPSDNGWSNWTWRNAPKRVTFTGGAHKVRFYFDNPCNFNFRNLRFTFYDPNAIDPNVPFVSDGFDLDSHSLSAAIGGEDNRVMYFTLEKDKEYTLIGDLAGTGVVFNVDFFERTSANKVKFLGENGNYKLFFNPVRMFVLVEPPVRPSRPNNYMIFCGTGFGYPTKVSSDVTDWYTTGWDTNNLMRYIICRGIGNNQFQATVFISEDANVKPFENQASWWDNGKNFSTVAFTGEDVFQSVGGGDDNWGPNGNEIEGQAYRIILDAGNNSAVISKFTLP